MVFVSAESDCASNLPLFTVLPPFLKRLKLTHVRRLSQKQGQKFSERFEAVNNHLRCVMLGRDAHVVGAPCRVSADGGYVVTGGSDGSVVLHTVSHFPKSKPLWTIPKAHKGAVTAVACCCSRGFVFSCGRDGSIYLYRNAFPTVTSIPQSQSAPGVVTTLLCRVTGEVNCLVLSADGHRLFFAGDTVRCFSFLTKKVTTIPLPVSHPICSIAISPCVALQPPTQPAASSQSDPTHADTVTSASPAASGTVTYGEYIAMASVSNRSVGVLSVPSACYEGSPTPLSFPALPTKFVLEKQVPLEAVSGGSTASFKMDWSLDPQRDNSVRLYIPTKEGIRVYEVQEELGGRLFNPQGATQAPESSGDLVGATGAALGRLSFLGCVIYNGLTDVVGVSACRVTKNKLELVCASLGGSRLLNLRVDDSSVRKLTSASGVSCHQAADIALLSTTNYSKESGTNESPAVADFCVDRGSGSLCAVDTFGRLAVSKAFAVSTKKKAPVQQGATTSSQPAEADPQPPQSQASGILSIGSSALSKNPVAATQQQSAVAEEISSETGDDDDDSTSSSSDDADSAAVSDEANVDFDDGTNENLKLTAKDLIDNNPTYISDEDEAEDLLKKRRSKAKQDLLSKRNDESSASRRQAEKEMREKRPSFLDDEAEEASSGEGESEGSSDPLEEEERRLRRARGEESSDNESEADDDETALQHAYRVEEKFRRRYNIEGAGLRKKSPHHQSTKRDDNDQEDDARSAEDFGEDTNDGYASGGRQSRKGAALAGGGGGVALLSPHMWWYSFQSGATHFPSRPMSSPSNNIDDSDTPAPSNRQNRFLAFNGVGALLHTATHIYVLFHDLGRATVRLVESRPCTMGALSNTGFAICFEQGVTVSGDPSHNDNHSSSSTVCTIMHRSFVSMGLEPEWSVTLAKGEQVLNLAVGGRFVAVATSLGYIRIFSLSGIEMAVFSVPHHVVCLTGVGSPSAAAILRNGEKASDPLLMVTMDSTMTHYVAAFDVANDGDEVIKRTELPLTPPAGIYSTIDTDRLGGGGVQPTTLRWVGWGDNGVVYSMDSIGVLRRMARTPQWGASSPWMPIYDPRHLGAVRDRHWVWGVTSDETMLSYHSIAEGGLEPFTTDDVEREMLAMEPVASYDILPSTTRARTCLPLIRSHGDAAMVARDQYLRAYQRAVETKRRATHYTEELARIDQQLDERLLQLFQSAVTSTKTSRAVDIATMFQLSATLKAAATFANDRHARVVTEKCIALLEARTKQKRHRVCRLPLQAIAEKTELLDREKDRILKDLLRRERDGTLLLGGGTPVVAPLEAPATAKPVATHESTDVAEMAPDAASHQHKSTPLQRDEGTPPQRAQPRESAPPSSTAAAASPPSATKPKNPFAKSPAAPTVSSRVTTQSSFATTVVAGSKRERNERPEAGPTPGDGSVVTTTSVDGQTRRVVTFDDDEVQGRDVSPERVGNLPDAVPVNLSPAKKQYRAEPVSHGAPPPTIHRSPAKQSTLPSSFASNSPSKPPASSLSAETDGAVKRNPIELFKQSGLPTMKLTTSKAFSGQAVDKGMTTTMTTPVAATRVTSPIFQDLSQQQHENSSIIRDDPFLNTQQRGSHIVADEKKPSESFAEALRRRYQEDNDDDEEIPSVGVGLSLSMSAE